MQMKHNSAIKQLMRELNTQLALKETEVDTAVKETIGEEEEDLSSLVYLTRFTADLFLFC